MDYSAANTQMWNAIVQIGIIASTILVANIMRRKISFVRNSLMPTAVLAGFILLLLKSTGIISVDLNFLETLTYHGIAIGFIAMSLRVPEKSEEAGELVGLKSGAIIVSSYMIQAITGLVIALALKFTIKPDFFQAAGILLPLGYGQGPGQANNIGSSYEALGFTGGRSFGLALATAGYLCACIVGVLYIAWHNKRGKFAKQNPEDVRGSVVTVDTFQHENEIPIAESIDRLSIQVCLVLMVYLLTYLLTWGITSILPEAVGNMLNSLLWGFNFIIGSALAMLTRVIMSKLRNAKIMHRQYQNNYLLSRISGLAFDVMIVAGIGSIEFEDLSGLWLPFILMAVAGGVITMVHLQYVCKKVYPGYYYEGFVSMYGMMTGTISSGVLLLRELDPQLKTPAANNLVLGSSFAILLGAPLLVLASIAPKSVTMTLITLGIIIVYDVFLIGIVNFKKKPKK